MILPYLRERFPIRVFGPLALVLAAAALGRDVGLPELALAAVGALLLLAQFRLWDDMADRRKDAVSRPHRVLVKAASPGLIAGLGMSLLILNTAFATQRGTPFLSLSLLGLLHVALGGYYLFRRGRTLLGDQLLLAKYPVFVLILSGERMLDAPVAVGTAALVVYAGVSVYEAWHDPVSPLALLFGGHS